MKRTADVVMGAVHPFLPVQQLRGQMDLLSADAKAAMFGVRCPPGEDVTRQEFKEECDTAHQLRRFGAGQAFERLRPANGEINFDLDLLTAQLAVQPAREAYARLPLELRQVYPTLTSFVRAVESGEVRATETPAGGSGGGEVAPPSPKGAADETSKPTA